MDRKILGRWDSMAISIGIVIGVGIFRVPSEVAKHVTSPMLIMAAWVLGGLISFIGGLCYAELTSVFPDNGGDYVYLRKGYGRFLAFLFAWTELTIIRTGAIASVSLIFADYARSFLGLPESFSKAIAIVVIVALWLLNLGGLGWGKTFQSAITAIKMVALALLLMVGFLSPAGHTTNLFSWTDVLAPGTSAFAVFTLVMVPILWTYGGWQEGVFVAGETKDPQKAVPFALLASVATVTLTYVLMNFLYLRLFTPATLSKSTIIASDTFRVLCGPDGTKLLEAFIMVYGLGCINAMIITGSRITGAIANDNILFKFLSKTSGQRETPVRAISINALWAVMFVCLGSFEKLLFFTGAAHWLFAGLVAASLIILRRKYPELLRPFRVPLFPWLPVIYACLCALLCVETFVCFPQQSLIGLAMILAGAPFFLFSRHLDRDKQVAEKS